MFSLSGRQLQSKATVKVVVVQEVQAHSKQLMQLGSVTHTCFTIIKNKVCLNLLPWFHSISQAKQCMAEEHLYEGKERAGGHERSWC